VVVGSDAEWNSRSRGVASSRITPEQALRRDHRLDPLGSTRSAGQAVLARPAPRVCQGSARPDPCPGSRRSCPASVRRSRV
jgi:hypothetical protein